ncbi:MAG: basic amino acid/polyamine antiporter, family [Solirubrobacterales bacterium]|jgi:APA family basic amino acid/polyamine antiporter|nr:basic amino acid/polyamine antiporter, family [Solirubrobacterales bacterium]
MNGKKDGRLQRGLGVPWLFAAAYSAVGFSIYFALGVVADRGLGLTPLIFLAAGLLFGLTTLTYVEGGAMFRERGGSSTFARYAFNELIAFIAGWAILLDYLIVLALAALSVPHYLEPIWSGFGRSGYEIGVAAAVIAGVCILNIFNVTGRGRQRSLAFLALADLALQLAVIVVGLLVVFHPDRLTEQLNLFTDPSAKDIVYAAVVAMLAYAGIEAASDLAPDVEVSRRDLKRVAMLGAFAVPLVYAGMAAIALMAVPVVAGPQGPETALGGEFIENPVLGVVSAFHPHWVAETMRWTVALVAAPVLIWAANTSMLGVSRHIYTLAINRQIPSWLGKLEKRKATPYVAIVICGVIALGLVIPTNVKLLAGIYAFGATLAITIAHLSIIRLRVKAPDKQRPFRIPFGMRWGPAELPLPAIVAAVLSGLAFLSVLAFHTTARWVGLGWMVFGLTFYVVYRKVFEGTTLTKRVSVSEQALTKQVPEIEFRNILVPVFGTKLDDDIVATAGRLAAAEQEESSDGEADARLDVIYVMEVPLTLPLDAQLPQEREDEAQRALQRAREVGEEYEDVEVTTDVIRARKVGAGILEAARRSGAEAIVIGGEPPTKIRGGAKIGGLGGAKPAEIGAATEYVLMKAPCRVLLTAPPETTDTPETSEAPQNS